MKTNRFLVVACVSLALAFTFSCSSVETDSTQSTDSTQYCYDNSITSGSFTDPRDGKTYNTIKICTQQWMAENLNYEVPNNTANVCYKNYPHNCEKYGRLYNWATAMNACPTGWHLPSVDEWDALESHLEKNINTFLTQRGGWFNFNLSRFEDVHDDQFFDNNVSYSTHGYWWTATQEDASYAYKLYIYMNSNKTTSGSDENKSSLLSVRCIKGNSNFTPISSSSVKPSSSSEIKPSSSSGGSNTSSNSNTASGACYITYEDFDDLKECVIIKSGTLTSADCNNNFNYPDFGEFATYKSSCPSGYKLECDFGYGTYHYIYGSEVTGTTCADW
ncbi:MAG: hypothetical protein FWC26_04875 [Fibromonadales bacterium]|nr:hypothetical protein [Fibromonadales bacterium]